MEIGSFLMGLLIGELLMALIVLFLVWIAEE